MSKKRFLMVSVSSSELSSVSISIATLLSACVAVNFANAAEMPVTTSTSVTAPTATAAAAAGATSVVPHQAGAASASVLTFKEWKIEKVQMSIQKMSSLRAQIQILKMETGNKDVLPLERQLSQESFTLEVIKDLSISDYFMLYIRPIKNSNKYKKLAERMSFEEVAELAESFSKNIGAIDDKAQSTAPPQTIYRATEKSRTTLASPSRLSLDGVRNKF